MTVVVVLVVGGRRCLTDGARLLGVGRAVGTSPRAPPIFLSPLIAAAQASASWKKFPPPSTLHPAASQSTLGISSSSSSTFPPFLSLSRIIATPLIPGSCAQFSILSAPPYPPDIMSEITHPTIKDGWFREISDMWPGQAMTLKVDKVLHHEKSKYQDVLVFKSTDYGTVLVLDNVIQCTERDEFSYQEMIAHLALNSHPNPKKVLVIGGGDGGVLREVVKHDCVEEATLCDIDEAVIRLSKQYLPNMAEGLTHPKSTVHIGDGFKFLDDYKNSFDVIITDSSDPEGPAESLFKKPYFQLLHDALREGGVISTQGCMSRFFLRKVVGSLGTAACGNLGWAEKPSASWLSTGIPLSHGRYPSYPRDCPRLVLLSRQPCFR
ncbi:Spermidine synthase [Purpureocillium takamizusanense]|uniref:Spermidine synthase n=1 Tax=Purpureocillium takamizusanense TaxID=2060973 RepID=A0A9Q8V8H2_9HYPO|nr:Spermidine synthase [Purpureocillium takamizusanense]UNI15797.1 Spermidine synthase [Purpureocillium takamizusanense]